jgi:thiamine-phosphate pyrophosphorylase
VAIGGISQQNVRQLAGSGICGIAVISAIFAQKDIKAATALLKETTMEMLNE